MFKGTPSVTIRGGGIAALCCAFLLKQAGLHIRLEETGRPKLPAILLSNAALALIRDIFKDPDLLRNLPEVRKRVVAWGPSAAPVSLDHSAIVVSEEIVLESVRSKLTIEQIGENEESDWLIVASHPLPPGCEELAFGTRTGSVAAVKLAAESAVLSCWIESVANGWLFLIESGPQTGWLLAIGGKPEVLLKESVMIEKQITDCDPVKSEVPVYPRISTPLCGSHWLACGTAAMAFDPICGDGTANAIREAILAAAVIRTAAQDDSDLEGLLSHYETRLFAGFRRHLAMCMDFYVRGYKGRWWKDESAALKSGIEWCDSKLAKTTRFRYRLEGFDLHPIEPKPRSGDRM